MLILLYILFSYRTDLEFLERKTMTVKDKGKCVNNTRDNRELSKLRF